MRKVLLLFVFLLIPFAFAQSVDCSSSPDKILQTIYNCPYLDIKDNQAIGCDYHIPNVQEVLHTTCGYTWLTPYIEYEDTADLALKDGNSLCGRRIQETTELDNLILPYFYLFEDLICLSGDGIAFEKSNIIFDCQGYNIIGNPDFSFFRNGIIVRTVSNFTIQNCNIKNYTGYGIFVSNNNNIRIFNSSVSNIKKFDNSAGIFFSGTSQNTVVNNTIYENNIGIQLGGGAGGVALTTFQNNTIINNTQYGMYSFSQINRDNIFTQNTFENEVNVFYRLLSSNNFFNQSTLGNYWSDWGQNPGFEEGMYITNPSDEILYNIDFHPLQCTQDRHC
ncbi:MAG: right-handed parallel beta-helix repeat-containing protein, partial [Candidatus Woesearchaeota archaeon]